jgi:hypothetical protein
MCDGFRQKAQINMPLKNPKKMQMEMIPYMPTPPMLLMTFSSIISD